MHGVGADQWRGGRPPSGVGQDGLALPPAESAVASPPVLEGGDLAGGRLDQAVDDDVPDMRQPAVASYFCSSLGPERLQRVRTHNTLLVEVVPSVATYGNDPVGTRQDCGEADPFVVGERVDEPGVQLLDVFPGEALGLLREVDERQVARAGDHDVGPCGGGLFVPPTLDATTEPRLHAVS